MNITEIKDKVLQVDILDVISPFVKLKRIANEWVGLCPFHAERSPSFSVNNKKSIYKCFGCGASGDSIKFVQEHEKLSFIDACKYIAARKHISLEFDVTEKRGTRYGFKPAIAKETKAVDGAIMLRSLQSYQNNGLALYLGKKAGELTVLKAFFNYNVGTAKDGSTIYWQIDQFMRIRTAQKIKYDETGHRVKWGTNYAGETVKLFPFRLFTTDKGYTPCLFGEHLLFDYKRDTHTICIVESEKSAVVCSIYLPVIDGKQVIWMSSCGNNGLTDDKIFVLKGLPVTLCPDFSYLSRASWGVLPMRRKEIDGKLKIHPEGEVDDEYVSSGARLQKLGCDVSFYDPFPNVNDGSDIADELLKYNAPAFIPKSDVIMHVIKSDDEYQGF